MSQKTGLPATYTKVLVKKFSNEFKQATEISTFKMRELVDGLQPHDLIVKHLYLGINASDINFTAGRYDPSVKLPFECGFEALGIVVMTGAKSTVNVGATVAIMGYGSFAEYRKCRDKDVICVPVMLVDAEARSAVPRVAGFRIDCIAGARVSWKNNGW